MTASEMIDRIKKHRGTICIVSDLGNEPAYIRVFKRDLIKYFKNIVQDVDCGAVFDATNGIAYVRRVNITKGKWLISNWFD